ncbi:DUF427 domain-containing protein [Thermosynechococcus sp. QS41]|uniref:DUF427 domain-containing protein n=1 Tax=Thermosynechococcus sp. QS41 TaxID=3074101 RepID=UPI002877CCA1|nr:DUF427 domain-containing protein [Thermosynechococcus sp. QS41]WNC60275.1 DUF427 domain-containing protein [Thermosynechococcus sp. QS41]
MQRIPPAPGQESVWDYPRPPRVEPTSKHLRVVFNGVVIADTQRGQRVLETSHPPVYYFPPEDVQVQYLLPSARQTFCEWKGQGAYYHVKVGDRQADNAAWYYPKPTPAFAPICNYIAFYAALMDECTVDGVVVIPQPGGFYGGWITPDIVGPFKGAPGTWGW